MKGKDFCKDLDQMIQHLKECRPLPEDQIKTLCEMVIITIHNRFITKIEIN